MSPVRTSIRFVGGLACTWGCFGVGSRTCLEAFGIRFGWLSVCFLFWKSLDSLLSLRLSPSFLASSSSSCNPQKINQFPGTAMANNIL